MFDKSHGSGHLKAFILHGCNGHVSRWQFSPWRRVPAGIYPLRTGDGGQIASMGIAWRVPDSITGRGWGTNSPRGASMDTRQQLTCGTSFQIVGQPSSSQPFSHGPRRAQHTRPNLTNMHGRTQEPNTRDPPLARSSSSQRSRLPLVPLPVLTSQIEPGLDR